MLFKSSPLCYRYVSVPMCLACCCASHALFIKQCALLFSDWVLFYHFFFSSRLFLLDVLHSVLHTSRYELYISTRCYSGTIPATINATGANLGTYVSTKIFLYALIKTTISLLQNVYVYYFCFLFVFSCFLVFLFPWNETWNLNK